MLKQCCVIWIITIGVLQGHDDFEKLYEDFWEWRLQDNPEFASNIGDKRYTDKVEDYSIAAIATRKAALEDYLDRLGLISRDRLEFNRRVSYDVMKDTIEAWVNGSQWQNYSPMNPVSFLDGPQNYLSSRAGQVKFTKEEDFSKFAHRIGQYAVQLTQMKARLQVAVAQQTTFHLVSVSNVPAAFDSNLLAYKNNVTAFPMYSPFLQTIEGIVSNQTARDEIRSTARANIDTLLIMAQDLKDFMVNTYIPNARTTFGVYGLPNGGEYYQATLKWQLSTDITPDEIHEIGLKEVDRIFKEMKKIVERATVNGEKFTGTPKEYFDHLRGDTSNFIADPDEALQAFKDVHTERIEPKLKLFFKDIPDVPLVVEKMASNGPSGIYKNGAPDGSRPGVFYANVHSPVPKFDLPALMLHETDPGHHLQDAYALTSPDIPMFRRATDFSKYFAAPMHFPFYTAYSEGWGLYSEDLGTELDIFRDDLERLGKYGLEIFRAGRLVVDTGIHHKRWSRDQAIEYMMNYTAYTEDFITREIDRYATWPGQACSYMIGKLKIHELRNRAVRALCSHYSIKDFHSAILTNGAMPLWVMENVVDEWIETVKKQHNIPDKCVYDHTSGSPGLFTGFNLAFVMATAAILQFIH